MYVTGTTNDKIYEYTLTSIRYIQVTYRGVFLLMVILSA